MSSNAFPRSRSRVRHHRVPRSLSCDHPRFLQLVNELARINRHHHHHSSGNTANGLNNNTQQQSDHQSHQNNSEAQHTAHNNNNNDTQTSGNNLHHHNRNNDDCCQHQHSKTATSTQQDSTNTTNFGYSKQSLVEQQNSSSDYPHPDSTDLRSQDENRSKRKRSSNDSTARKASNNSCTASSTSTSSSLCGASSGSSKRHKSSPDNVRPLSPSFTKCPICLLDCMDRDPSFTNTCFHLFCYVCIDNWTKSKATCPLCRTKFTKIIYNIKSATNYQEQIASPVRRDDDDGYIADRLMLEHLSSLNSNSSISGRNNSNNNNNSEEVQFLFENLRSSEVLMPQYFVNQIDPRQGESVHSFNAVASQTNFNPNVPHPPFTTTGYPMASNYIALFPNRLAPAPNTAITSAYNSNASLTSDPSARNISRSGRFMFSRNYEPQMVSDSSTRSSRASATSANQLSVNLDRNHHHHHHHQQQPQHPHLHQPQHPGHHQHHQHNQQRSTMDMTSRQNARLDQIQPTYFIQQRHHDPLPSAYARRLYNSPQVEHHILDTLYRHVPDSR